MMFKIQKHIGRIDLKKTPLKSEPQLLMIKMMPAH